LIPVFMPVTYPGIEVRADDRVRLVCSRRVCTEDSLHPDYYLNGNVMRGGEELFRFRYRSANFERSFESSEFYRRLWANRSAQPQSDGDRFGSQLLEHAALYLPSYMMPSDVVVLDALPLTATGKIDRHALPSPAAKHAAPVDSQPASETEAILAAIWS